MIRLLVLIPFLAVSLSGKAQTGVTSDFGIMGVVGYYIGDLNPYGHFRGLHPRGGILHRVNFNQRFSLQSHFLYTRVSASDSRAGNSFQTNRNLSFRSPITEIGSQIEFNFFNFSPANPKGSTMSNAPKAKKNFSPYIFGGVVYFQMNPQSDAAGEYIDLVSLGTEGQASVASETQERQYSKSQIALPFGVGTKFKLAKGWTLSLEWGMRKTFTDYLDDVSGRYADPALLTQQNSPLATQLANQSLTNGGYPIEGTQRGNSESKDWYNITALQLTIQLGDKNVCPQPK